MSKQVIAVPLNGEVKIAEFSKTDLVSASIISQYIEEPIDQGINFYKPEYDLRIIFSGRYSIAKHTIEELAVLTKDLNAEKVNKFGTFINKLYYVFGNCIIYDKNKDLSKADLENIVKKASIPINESLEFTYQGIAPPTNQQEREEFKNRYISYLRTNYILTKDQIARFDQELQKTYVIEGTDFYQPVMTCTLNIKPTVIVVKLWHGTSEVDKFKQIEEEVMKTMQINIQQGEKK